MMQVGSAVTGQVTFGRDAALFESLISFVAQLSLVLWTLVLFTLVIRFIGIHMYRRGAARMAYVSGGARTETAPAGATTGTFDEIHQPAGASAPLAAAARTPRRVPALAAGSTGW
ncbi:hypothetical protein [Kocuria sp. NPDC057446]|uniref:hypothetical protein n=1 Tax=Kocuria sp. NPDC057446 TaxID=3346137 RepID=UPI0036D16201